MESFATTTTILFLKFHYEVSTVFINFMEKLETISSNTRNRTIFKGLFFSFIIYVFPIMLADILYRDDIRRTLVGDPSTWYRDARPLMAFIVEFFNLGAPIFDISPLTQILGVAILALALTLFSRKYFPKHSTKSAILCCMMFIISPFFLENLSYHFESLGMCLSLALYLILFSLPDRIQGVSLFVLTFFFSFCVLCLYQAAIGTFGALLFLTGYLKLHIINWKQFFISALYMIGGCLAAVVIYMLLVAPLYVPEEGYQATHSVVIAFSSSGLRQLLTNIYSFVILLRITFFTDTRLSGIYLSVALVLVSLLSLYIHYKKQEQENSNAFSFSKLFFAFITPFCILVNVFLPLTFLENTIIMPRSCISFNIFMLFIGILLISFAKLKTGYQYVLLLFIPIFLFGYGFSYTYGNLLKSQRNYECFVAESIVNDLQKIKTVNGKSVFYVDGNRVVSKEVALAQKKFKIFDLLISKTFRKNFWFGGHLLSHYSTYPIIIKKLPNFKQREFRLVTDTSCYQIMQSGNEVIINFK